MEPVRIDLGQYVAHLDAVNGLGLLITPDPEQDVWLGAVSLHAAEWDLAVTALGQRGFAMLLDEDELPIEYGMTRDGRAALSLIAREAAGYTKEVDAMGEAWQGLSDWAEVSPVSIRG